MTYSDLQTRVLSHLKACRRDWFGRWGKEWDSNCHLHRLSQVSGFYQWLLLPWSFLGLGFSFLKMTGKCWCKGRHASSPLVILHLSGVSLTSVALLPLTWKKVKVLVFQLCLTLCNSMDGIPKGSFLNGILQAAILKCVAIPFSRLWTWVSVL